MQVLDGDADDPNVAAKLWRSFFDLWISMLKLIANLSTMAGQPYKVGRFAHTLRVRLMREHLGVDVDGLDEADLMANSPEKPEEQQEPWDPEGEQDQGGEEGITRVGHKERRNAAKSLVSDATNALSEGLID